MGSNESLVHLNLLEVHPDYRFGVGTSASPIQISALYVKVFGGTGFYMECGDDGGAASITGQTLIQMRTPGAPVELGTESGSTDGSWGRVILARGSLTAKANLLWDNSAGELDIVSNEATATLAAGSDTLVNLFMNAGTCHSDAAITYAYLAGGTLYQDTALATTVHVFDGATYVLNHTAATNVVLHNGATLDLMQNGVVKTITNLVTYPGCRLLWSPEWDNAIAPYGPHRVTNFYDFRGVG
jgi:hypothetical protein